MRRLRSVNKKRRASFNSRFRSKLLYEVGVDGVAKVYSVFDNLNLSDADAFLIWVDHFLVPKEEFVKQGIKSGTYFRYVVSRKKHVKIQEIEKPYQAKGKTEHG
jgi:hypothetical protein